MSGILGQLFGGDPSRQQQAQDFMTRYDTGAPHEGFSGDEAYNQYQQVAGQLSPEMYQQSAQEAFSRMQPQERMQFGQMVQQQAQQRGMADPSWQDDDTMYQDPGYLAQMTGRLEQTQPGMLGQLLGGGGGGGGGGGLGGLLGGGQQGGGSMPGGGQQSGGSMLDNPLAKAAIGGVAAMAMRRLMSGR